MLETFPRGFSSISSGKITVTSSTEGSSCNAGKSIDHLTASVTLKKERNIFHLQCDTDCKRCNIKSLKHSFDVSFVQMTGLLTAFRHLCGSVTLTCKSSEMKNIDLSTINHSRQEMTSLKKSFIIQRHSIEEFY